MSDPRAHGIAEAYRWQRRLGNQVVRLPHCTLVSNSACADVWDANHIDEVTAERADEIVAVFAALDRGFPHTAWRVVHTDVFTPDAFVAELAFRGFEERPVVIQMALEGELAARGAVVELRPVVEEADWDSLRALVVADFTEGRRTGGLDLSPEFCATMVASYRAKTPSYRFVMAMVDGEPAAYGACAAAPNGVGMVEDIFTLARTRGRGIATGLIAHLVETLKGAGCKTVFVGAIANERAKQLYARLGFRPVMLTRTWVREEF